MSTTWFTSDLHLGHTKVAEIRGFEHTDGHDEQLILRWANRVKDDDIVWVLGDLAVEGGWRYALDILADMPGRKRLVTGNHDQCWVGKSSAMRFMADYLKVFEVVTPWARAKVGSTKVLLSHFPYQGDHTEEDRYPEYRLPFSTTPLLHGHTHSERQRTIAWDPFYNAEYAMGDRQERTWQVHVGVDAWGLAPVAGYWLERFVS